MSRLIPFGRFYLPGPTEVRHEVLEAQVGPMLAHRSREMEELIAGMQPGLRQIFRTERPVWISTSSATGLMEAAVRNGVRRRVLSLVNGAFSERFAKIAEACGKEVTVLEVPWGEPHLPDQVAEALAGGGYDAVTVVHCETSTGVLNPIAELAEAAHAADAVLLVDSVSGMAGTPVETDRWGIDFVLTGSQKAFALPPGLALGVAQEHMLSRAEGIPNRGIYFDFLEFERYIRKNQTPNTPAVSLFYALAAQVEHIMAEGIEARWDRHRALAEYTYRWVAEMNHRGVPIRILAREGYRSPTVTTLTLPEGWTGPQLAAAVGEEGFTIATGYGRLKESAFRIGHMGDHTLEALDALLLALTRVLGA